MNQAVIGYGCIILSVVVHASAMLGAARRPPAPAPALRTEVELALPPPTPSPPPLPRAPILPPEAAPLKAQLAPRLRPVRQAPAPAPAPPEGAPPTPALSGNTLLGTADAGWTAPAGNGAEREGPVQTGAPASAPPPAPAHPAPAAAPVMEPLAQLSRKPIPPALASALERNYPPGARRQGRSGEAKVRALIDALGRVASVTVTFESGPEFGLACQNTLLHSQWTPPLGQLGQPTATFVTYRCKFRVDD